MLNLREIYKPTTIEEAIVFLARPDTVALAGGTELVASRRKDVRAVVDLSNLGLAYIRDSGGAVAIGAMTRLVDVAESPMLRAAVDGVVAQAAHRSAASLLRNQSTVGGTIIAEPAGILATILEALEATLTLVSFAQLEKTQLGVTEFLTRRRLLLRGAIITEAVIPVLALGRRAAIETVARTPRDKPIVAVCAALGLEGGVVRSAGIAVGGLGETALRASKAEALLSGQRMSDELIERAVREALKGMEPLSDYRGSAEYRREMARVLTARALMGVWKS